MTASGYPFVVKRLKRGQSLSAAQEIFRGTAKDGGYGVSPLVLHDGTGHRAILIERPLSTFEAEYYLVSADRVSKLLVPGKISIESFIDDKLVLSLNESWVVDGKTFPQGALVAFDWDEATHDPTHLKPMLLYTPGPRESFAAASASKDALLVTTLDNVRGRAFVYRPARGGNWQRQQLALPDNETIGIVATNIHADTAFLSVAGFLQPSSLWLLATPYGKPTEVKSLPPKFDASRDTVEIDSGVSVKEQATVSVEVAASGGDLIGFES